MRFLLYLTLVTSTVAADAAAIREVTKKAYDVGINAAAVVVFDVNWGRRWNCAGHENAELMKLEFDRISGPPRVLHGILWVAEETGKGEEWKKQ